jgi:RNA polymerase sigma-70 factor (ECF subfamily)
MAPAQAIVDRPGPDAESREWLDALAGPPGVRREQATARLHELLLRAARFELARRRHDLRSEQRAEFEDLAVQAADDALLAVMRKLDTYRGDSRFTTWAYKFALLEAGVRLRRRAWQDREVPLDGDAWARLADRRSAPHADAEAAELITAVRLAIDAELTARQRAVLVAITLNDVPIDVLAERLSTTRGALYKALHDGRQKLRARLAADGHDLGHLREGGTP